MKNTTNPILSNLLKKDQTREYNTNVASYNSIFIKGSILITLLLTAVITTSIFILSYINKNGYNDVFSIVSSILVIVGVISVFVSSFKPKTAKYLSFVYILCQGYIIGLINAVLIKETGSPVLGITAGVATLTVFLIMFILHTLKIFRVTNKFRKVLFTFLISFLIINLITTIIYFTTNKSVSQLLNLSPTNQFIIAITINTFVVLIASLFLLLDFENAKIIVSNGLPKDYEWVFLIGLFVTLIWLYTSILRLLLILFNRR